MTMVLQTGEAAGQDRKGGEAAEDPVWDQRGLCSACHCELTYPAAARTVQCPCGAVSRVGSGSTVKLGIMCCMVCSEAVVCPRGALLVTCVCGVTLDAQHAAALVPATLIQDAGPRACARALHAADAGTAAAADLHGGAPGDPGASSTQDLSGNQSRTTRAAVPGTGGPSGPSLATASGIDSRPAFPGPTASPLRTPLAGLRGARKQSQSAGVSPRASKAAEPSSSGHSGLRTKAKAGPSTASGTLADSAPRTRIRHAKRPKHSPNTPESKVDAPSAPDHARSISKHAWLHKRGHNLQIRNWKLRYCILTGAGLSYYAQHPVNLACPGPDGLKGVLAASDMLCATKTQIPGRSFTFQIKLRPVSGRPRRVYCFSTTCIEECNDWVSKLNHAIGRAKQ